VFVIEFSPRYPDSGLDSTRFGGPKITITPFSKKKVMISTMLAVQFVPLPEIGPQSDSEGSDGPCKNPGERPLGKSPTKPHK
jgi:hypothetical protein